MKHFTILFLSVSLSLVSAAPLQEARNQDANMQEAIEDLIAEVSHGDIGGGGHYLPDESLQYLMASMESKDDAKELAKDIAGTFLNFLQRKLDRPSSDRLRTQRFVPKRRPQYGDDSVQV